MAAARQKSLEDRCDAANRQRFADRPVFNIGDHVPVEMIDSLPVIEGIWRIGESTIIETVGKTSEPEVKLIDDAYRISAAGKHWRIVLAAPVVASADRVRRYFALRGVQTYWPRSVKLTYRGRGQKRRRVAFVQPLMFRYVFAHLPDDLDLHDIVKDPEAKANDVSGCVQFAGRAVAVPDVLMERIIARERAGEFNATFRRGKRTFAKVPDWLVDGGLARINKEGAFAGIIGEIEGVDDETGNVTVVVDMFGRATRVDLAVADLCAL